MPTSTAITASSGMSSRQLVEHQRRVEPAAAVGERHPGGLLGPPTGPAGGHDRRAARVGRPPGSACEQVERAPDRRPTAAPRRGGTCRASSGRSRPGSWARRWRSTCGCENDGAEHEQAVGLGHRLRRHGDAADARACRRPAGGRRARVPLALKVVMIGASRCSARATTCSRKARAPLPHTITGRSAAASRSTARSSSSSGGAMAADATPPRRGSGGGSSTAGELLHLVGEDQVGDVALDDGVLHRQCGQLGGVARGQHRLAPLGDRVEGLVERDLLEGTRARPPGSAPGR